MNHTNCELANSLIIVILNIIHCVSCIKLNLVSSVSFEFCFLFILTYSPLLITFTSYLPFLCMYILFILFYQIIFFHFILIICQ